MISISPPLLSLSEYTNQDSEGNVMLRAHAYKAQTPGQVTAYAQLDSGNWIKGYVGLTSDPAGAGELIFPVKSGAGGDQDVLGIAFLVAKNEYFEIVSEHDPTIRWKSFGPLQKPIDFN